MTKEDEDHFRNTNIICWFCETEILDTKVRDHCHLTSSIEDQHMKNVIKMLRQKQSNFIPILFHNFSNYDCHLFFKNFN